jgi:hypothetical protein
MARKPSRRDVDLPGKQPDQHENDGRRNADQLQPAHAEIGGEGEEQPAEQGHGIEGTTVETLRPGKTEGANDNALPADGEQRHEQRRHLRPLPAKDDAVEKPAVAPRPVADIADECGNHEVDDIADGSRLHQPVEADAAAQRTTDHQPGDEKAPAKGQQQERHRVPPLRVPQRRMRIIRVRLICAC